MRIEGLDAGESFLTAFPPSGAVLSMLALDRDVEDFAEAGKGMSLAAAHYRRAAMEAEVLRPLRSNYALLYAAAWKEITRSQIGREREERLLASLSQSPDLAALGEEGALSLPPKSDLEYSHPFALDIFFDEIETRGMVERGPHIRSLEAGIVVAAADDWRGGAGAVAWEKGGLSPSSGNGVIVFSPGSGRYYSYFHFFEVAVRRGDAVREGDILGRGGNTGANARKPGHGGHLHLEIYDSVRDRALSAWEIRALL